MKPFHYFTIVAATVSFFFLLHFGISPYVFQGDVIDIIPNPSLTTPGAGLPGEAEEYDFFRDFIPAVIRLSMDIIGAVMIGFMTYAGILLVISGLDENYKEKAKNIFYRIIIGAIIVSVAYAVVYGITQLQIF